MAIYGKLAVIPASYRQSLYNKSCLEERYRFIQSVNKGMIYF